MFDFSPPIFLEGLNACDELTRVGCDRLRKVPKSKPNSGYLERSRQVSKRIAAQRLNLPDVNVHDVIMAETQTDSLLTRTPPSLRCS
jgi:hypothetical protein